MPEAGDKERLHTLEAYIVEDLGNPDPVDNDKVSIPLASNHHSCLYDERLLTQERRVCFPDSISHDQVQRQSKQPPPPNLPSSAHDPPRATHGPTVEQRSPLRRPINGMMPLLAIAPAFDRRPEERGTSNQASIFLHLSSFFVELGVSFRVFAVTILSSCPGWDR
jgi:hypothetical protein